MCSFVQRLRLLPHAAVLAVVSAGIAGCSGDTSRFNDNIFDSIFADKNGPEMTGSIQGGQGAPVGRVETRPLAPQGVQGSYSPNSGIAGGGRGMASYAPIRRIRLPRPLPKSLERLQPPSRHPPATGPGKAAPPLPSPREIRSTPLRGVTVSRPRPSSLPTILRPHRRSIRANSWSFRATFKRATHRRPRPSLPLP